MNETPRSLRPPIEPGYLRPGGNREVRRRRQRRTASRVILWCCLWLAGAALATFCFRSGWLLLTDPERLPLERVIVEGAADRVNHEVESRLTPLLGRNVLTVDLGEVERSAMTSPWVKSAAVRLRLPSALLVVLQPREVAALVLAGDGVHMVDPSGSDIGRYSPPDSGENHPVITGVMDPGGRASAVRLASGIRVARLLAEGAPEFAEAVSALDVSRPDRITATLRDFRPPIYLSPEDPLRNLDRLAAARGRIEAGEIDAEYIDLRFRDRIAIMPVRQGAGASGA